MPRDYSLTGPDGQKDSPSWFRPAVDPADIRALMVKSDWIAGRDAVIWLGLLILSGTAAVALWPSWWSAPLWAAYGVLYASASDARWHECGHRTAFATPWMNTVIYHIASFCLMRNPHVWRASHVRHHTDTIVVGRDPEIQLMRPPDLLRWALNIFGILDTPASLRRLALHARGQLHPDEATYVRAEDVGKVAWTARVHLAIYVVTVSVALLLGSIVPLLLVGLPRFYGVWHMVMTGALQHLGLAENVSDHRLNTRTVMMNPVSRFIYLNMNYHVEHHMFTMVPYYRLPDLHALIRHDLPAPEPSIPAAFRRLLPVLVKQLRNQNAVIVPALPTGAAPYGPEVDHLRRHAV